MIPLALLLGIAVGMVAARRWALMAVLAVACGWGLVVGTDARSFSVFVGGAALSLSNAVVGVLLGAGARGMMSRFSATHRQ